jgi:hypothetical protein
VIVLAISNRQHWLPIGPLSRLSETTDLSDVPLRFIRTLTGSSNEYPHNIQEAKRKAGQADLGGANTLISCYKT